MQKMMRPFLHPAIALMNRLGYTKKFALLGLMSLAAISVVMYGLIANLDKEIHTLRQELEGLALIRPISGTVQQIQQHRGLSAGVFSGVMDMRDRRAVKEREIDAAFRTVDERLPPSLGSSGDWREIKDDWERLRKEGANWTADSNFEAHTKLINRMVYFNVTVADQYALILDPEFDTYYLIDTIVNRMPDALEHFGQIRASGTVLLAGKQISDLQKWNMVGTVAQFNDALASIRINLEKVGRNNPRLNSSLLAVSRDIDSSAQHIAGIVESDIIAGRFTMLPDDFFAVSTLAIDGYYTKMYELLLPMTEALIKARITRAENVLYTVIGIASLLFMAVAYLLMGIYYAIIGNVQSLARSAHIIAGGDLRERISLDTDDELKQVGDSFNEMAEGFSSLLAARRESEERYRLLVEASPFCIHEIGLDGRLQSMNRAGLDMLGLDEEKKVCGLPYLGAVSQQDNERIGALMRNAFEGNTSHFEFASSGESPLYFKSCFVPIRDGSGKVIKLMGITEDITARKKSEESMKLASLVYQNSSEAMMVTDPAGTIITINPAFTEVSGYTLDEVVGKNPHILKSGRQDEAFYQAMWGAINTTGYWRGEIWNRRKNGEVYAEWLTINTIFNEDGAPHYRVALFSDITQKKEFEELIWKQANYDPLTGLPNRRMFQDRLGQEIKKAKRDRLPLAMMFIDLDRFKDVNDTMGHEMGDMLLNSAAQRLKSCVRETDIVARLGGDEFTVILSGPDAHGSIERVANDILRELAVPFRLKDEVAYLSASIGITLYPEDASTGDALLKNADQAMYAAKSLGRNRYNYFTSSMQEAAQARLRLVNDLRRALPDKQFQLFYQPVVELASGVVHKAEALIRWKHPTRGLVSPAEFIPAAEDTRMIVGIGDWAFHEAARQAAYWHEMLHRQFQISVNMSPVQFHEENNFLASWFEYLQALGLSGQSIVVEITEGLLLDAGSSVTDKLLGFRDAGIQISLDDFGTGYSSLSYLQKFDIDYIKIDQSFVRNLAPDSNDMALCEAIIVMAHKLGMKVIAEGVETPEQRDLLAAAGCDFGQGYLFSKAVPAEEFEALLSGQLK